MNYLLHLNGFFERLDADERMSSYHISLYLALFRQWNASRFREQFVISRAETMEMARIGSANTYARCMKELARWGYIHYKPSSNLHFGSTVSCIIFDQESKPYAGTESDTAKPGSIPVNPILVFAGLPSGLQTDTAPGTGGDTASNTSNTSGIKTDTANDTAGDTGIKSDTGDDTTADTSTAGGTKSDTANGTGADTGIPSGLKSDTASRPNSRKNPAGDSIADTGTDTLLINDTNRIKQEKNQKREKEKTEKEKRKADEGSEKGTNSIPQFSEVSLFFTQNGFEQSEASRFYARYESAGWKTGNNQAIRSWQSLAWKWMTNHQKSKSHEQTFNPVGAGRFSVPIDKNYSEPL